MKLGLQLHPSTSVVKSKLLRVKERNELMKNLETLELPVVCKEVESLISKGMHLLSTLNERHCGRH